MLAEDLAACRAALGPVGASRTAWVKSLKKPGMPAWAKKDALRPFFDEWAEVLSTGDVAWAALVQANNELFDADKATSAPGELVHPARPEDGDAAELSAVGHALFSLRALEHVPEALRPIKATLDDELERSFGRTVPPPLAPAFPVTMTTTFFVRDWLPARALRGRVIPVVLPPEGFRAVVPLPAEKWPPALRRLHGAAEAAST